MLNASYNPISINTSLEIFDILYNLLHIKTFAVLVAKILKWENHRKYTSHIFP